ncbi:MAG: NUDIX domain-containing protein [Treponema sp.]|jgi:8-oxo-dGTP diphosphatase|nr:NUDIX domain-containing protein [Treponema sp.]
MGGGISVAALALEGNRVFIARRLEGGDLGGKWEFPGGKLEEGESEEEALVREFDEEFSVPVKAGHFVGSGSFEHRGIIRTLKGYRIELLSQNFRLKEHSEWRWAALEEIESLDFAPSDRTLLPFLKAEIEGEGKIQ